MDVSHRLSITPMTTFYLGIALFLLLNIFAGMVRLVRGPSAADRMLSIQLFGSTGVAILLVLGEAFDEPDVQNVALVFALLAVMAVVAWVRRVQQQEEEARDER